MEERIKQLKKERNAIILAHNYQPPEIQDIADYIGDSLDLSRRVAEDDAEVVVFCGVYFMAETANILSPEKITLLPDAHAGCQLADMITVEALKKKREEHPDAAVVCYVNSPAAVKAESDICCTSANALAVVNSLRDYDKIIFVPDKNLGSYVASKTDKEIILWDGCCPIHDDVELCQIEKLKRNYPDAVFIAHPECRPSVLALADEVLGTSGMIKFAKKTSANEVIIGTEVGMVYRLQKENPEKKFIKIDGAICKDMKLTTLDKVEKSLKNLEPRVVVSEEIRVKAIRAVNKMIEISG
ncbi:quinolinate synthase NadA [Candidatus Oleimmundimicrobium sp.]|uniref:quinolinate synthase NadA n=1 Tax=Candidatus Oleimmundimicrobium sp. TaxID=3060597 RepID=UPI0027250475|nr:quinolinate synthase NadA [Candidatus Oleimmundimicrobium sp.]MDO8885659.1 quinolinate synthase NadA [Candidatus Oleimmundimicrobium sp.]